MRNINISDIIRMDLKVKEIEILITACNINVK